MNDRNRCAACGATAYEHDDTGALRLDPVSRRHICEGCRGAAEESRGEAEREDRMIERARREREDR